MSRLFTRVTSYFGPWTHPVNKPGTLGKIRNIVYHRTSKEKKTRTSDFDDGYYYRNGEEHYAQTLRNRQEEQLRYDDLYYKLSRHKRHFNSKWVDFPNCECAEELANYDKLHPKGPRPLTACSLNEHSRIYDL